MAVSGTPGGYADLSGGFSPEFWAYPIEQARGDSNRLRTSVNRSRPLGEERWVVKIPARLGLEFNLWNLGRAKKEGIQVKSPFADL
jgi:hypothetical protein